MGVPFVKTLTETERLAPVEVSFGRFRLFQDQFLLLEDDKPVSLGSRALEILIVLLERPGALVNKQELMGRVWPNVFVEPNNLTVNMSALRRALRDGRDGNRFIINIPGRGYKFVASVTATNHQTAPSPLVGHTQAGRGARHGKNSKDLTPASYAMSGPSGRNVGLAPEVDTWS